MNTTLAEILSGKKAFCLIQKQDSEEILVLAGEPRQYDYLADIPRKNGSPGDRRKYDTISIVPFCQVKERGFQAHDQEEKIRLIFVDRQATINKNDLLKQLPCRDIELAGDIAYDTTVEEYAEIIRRVVTDEIGEGEGANFVIPRNGSGRIGDFSLLSACSLFSTLVREDYGTYWKYLFSDGSRYFIGSTPERHLLVERGRVKMNPISGTFRKDTRYECRDHFKGELLNFLTDPKEINELFMVVDEELKMMARMCSSGGAIVGPLLKEMSQLIHSEYLLSGKSDRDIIDLFRESMFAATVVGSPVENACRIIKKYSKTSRRYYGSALMLIGRDADGSDYLDSPITIRTLEIENDGVFHFSTGATLVKDSVAEEEVRETMAKGRAVLRSLRPTPGDSVPSPVLPALANDDDIVETLHQRNQDLSNFWFFQQDQTGTGRARFASITLTLIDNGDDFIYMLRHLCNSLGMQTTVMTWSDYEIGGDKADITLLGPGPGNPNNSGDEKIRRNMAIARGLLASGKKSLFVCLGHQILCRCLGYPVRRKDKPLQGSQLELDLFGVREKVGFYNTFAAWQPPLGSAYECATLDGLEEIAAVRSDNFIGYQFHPESILTKNGQAILCRSIEHLMAGSIQPS
ncbi:MAG: anthranilate synthase family protein [Pseudomonadota bacterium]